MAIVDSPTVPLRVPWTEDFLGDSATEALLTFLENRRESLGMRHNAFARWLGMNPAAWSQVRNGLLPVGPAFIGRVVVALPEAAEIFQRRLDQTGVR